jgi:hypothetical protein
LIKTEPMINIPYRAATFVGQRNRRRFVTRLATLPPVAAAGELPVTVYSFSGERDWPEQAASVRSFLRFVGLPQRFVVVSDGSHGDESRRQLERLHPCVSVARLEAVVRPDLPERIQRYAAQHGLGKKLSVLLSIPVEGPTIYSDSDILFFPGANALARLLQFQTCTPRYLLDCWPSLDARLLAGENEKALPVNSGFLIFGRPLDWRNALNRLEQMQGDCGFFTEQTLVHLAMKASAGEPLPADQFVLRAEDQFVFSDYYAGKGIALRHYISSIRSKFWHHAELFN